jgi:hypothetical protein
MHELLISLELDEGNLSISNFTVFPILLMKIFPVLEKRIVFVRSFIPMFVIELENRRRKFYKQNNFNNTHIDTSTTGIIQMLTSHKSLNGL